MKEISYQKGKTCRECEWFSMFGDEPVCGKPHGGRNYCYPDDEACVDYEDPNDHTIDKELRMALPSAKRDGIDTCFGYAKDIGNGMRQWTKVRKHSLKPFVYGEHGEVYVEGVSPRGAKVGISWMLTDQQLKNGEGVIREARERVLQAILIRLFVDDYEMGSPIFISVEDCEVGKKVIGSVIINNYK